MRVYDFQVQTGEKKAMEELLRNIDPRAPKVQALEGGNMKGPLYLVIIAESNLYRFIKGLEDAKIATVYTEPNLFEIEDALYRSDWYASWRFGAHPTIVQRAT